MTQSEYRELVLKDLDRKLATRFLPMELVTPTRKSLKDHSINICSQRFDAKDEGILTSVFGLRENKAAYIIAIQNSSAEDFKTLHNFLKDRSINTSFTNICLLAWMIDFEPRPYHPDLKSPEPKESGKRNPTTPPVSDGPKKNRTTLWLVSGFLLLTIPIMYIWVNTPTGNEKCMIWKDDHYEPINCNVKVIRKSVVPINHDVIDNFQKITRPDTLTTYSERKVHYIKTKKGVEFYTTYGRYPLDTTRRLWPMTNRILRKWALHLDN